MWKFENSVSESGRLADHAIVDRVGTGFAGDNPFSQQRIECLKYRFPTGDRWDSSLRRLQQLGFRAAIVGQRGSGKSTLLRSIWNRLVGQESRDCVGWRMPLRPVAVVESQAYPFQTVLLLSIPRVGVDAICLDGHQQKIASRRQQAIWLAEVLRLVDQKCLLLIDGIERLSWIAQQRLVRHQAAESRVAGLVINLHHRRHALPLPVWINTKPTAGLLADLIAELLAQAGVDQADHFQRRGQMLFRSSGNNIRDVLRQLYDEWFDRQSDSDYAARRRGAAAGSNASVT